MSTFPETIAVPEKNCRDFCGGQRCDYTWLTIGNFTQGTGFEPEVAAEIVKRWNCFETLLHACKEAGIELQIGSRLQTVEDALRKVKEYE